MLVIVTGLPASGKTTLARRIARDLRLPLFSRDDLKETLFDSLGWHDRDWSRRVGSASWALIYRILETQLDAGQSTIAEANFDPDMAEVELRGLRDRRPFEPVQIRCVADPAVLLQRYRSRAESGERHPGHVDHLNLLEFEARLSEQRDRPMDIGGTLMTVDTTDFSTVDYDGIVDVVRAALESGRNPTE